MPGAWYMPTEERLAELGMCCTQPWALWKWGAALFIHAAVGVLFAVLAPWGLLWPGGPAQSAPWGPVRLTLEFFLGHPATWLSLDLSSTSRPTSGNQPGSGQAPRSLRRDKGLSVWWWEGVVRPGLCQHTG